MVNAAPGLLALTEKAVRFGLTSTDWVVDRPLLSVTVNVIR